MAVMWEMWSNVERIQKAEQNSPSMKTGERGVPVHLLQAALIMNDCDVPDHGAVNVRNQAAADNAMYLGQTAAAVRAAEERFSLDRDSGIAGKQVIGRLDTINAGFYRANHANFGAQQALRDVPLATVKVTRAIQAIGFLQAQLAGLNSNGNPLLPLSVAQDALRTHFRLQAPGTAATGFTRPVTAPDLMQILNTYQRIA